MRVLLSVYHLLAYYLSFLLFGAFGLVLNIACLLCGWLPATPRTERFFQRWIHRNFALWVRWLTFARLVRFRFGDFTALPRRSGLVIVANHPGLMDATYLLARCPEAICVFKPAIRHNPILGAAARRAGYLASDGGHDTIRASAAKVAEGHTLLVFPEGTRSPEGGLHPLKSGFVLVARRAGAPIQLVRITCDSPLLTKGRAWWRVPPLPAQVEVTLGPRLPAPAPEAKTEHVLAEVEAWYRGAANRATENQATPTVPAAVSSPASDVTTPTTHVVIIPSYNTGPRLASVVADALRHWPHVQVVVDGSTDGSERAVQALAAQTPGLAVLGLPRNSGKGAAVLAGARAALARGATHGLIMDADGQHPAESIAEFMAASRAQPEAMILGKPVFGANVPPERRHGRKLSIGLVAFEVLGAGIADPLFGFRVYPLAPLLAILEPRRSARRYDFDTESAVRLFWNGVRPVNRAAPVRYFTRTEGGVSHFRYGRDNARLVWMHTRLITELLLWRWPAVRRQRRRWQAAGLRVENAVALEFAPAR